MVYTVHMKANGIMIIISLFGISFVASLLFMRLGNQAVKAPQTASSGYPLIPPAQSTQQGIIAFNGKAPTIAGTVTDVSSDGFTMDAVRQLAGSELSIKTYKIIAAETVNIGDHVVVEVVDPADLDQGEIRAVRVTKQ